MPFTRTRSSEHEQVTSPQGNPAERGEEGEIPPISEAFGNESLRHRPREADPAREARAEEVQGEREVLVGSAKGGASAAGWHAIEAFLRCPKEYQFKHVRGLRRPSLVTPDPLAFGQMAHAARAAWLASKCAPISKCWPAVQKAVADCHLDAPLPIRQEAETNCLALMAEYIKHWSTRPHPKALATEYPLGPAPLDESHPFFFYRTARLDDVSVYPEAGNALCIGEFKTTSVSVADCVQQYTLHGQPLLQWLLWKMAPQGEAMHGPIKYVMLDVAVKPYGDKKPSFARVALPLEDHALTWYVESMYGYLKAASRVERDSNVPRNVTACTRLIGRGRFPCEYRDLCAHGSSARTAYVGKNGESLDELSKKWGVKAWE